MVSDPVACCVGAESGFYPLPSSSGRGRAGVSPPPGVRGPQRGLAERCQAGCDTGGCVRECGEEGPGEERSAAMRGSERWGRGSVAPWGLPRGALSEGFSALNAGLIRGAQFRDGAGCGSARARRRGRTWPPGCPGSCRGCGGYLVVEHQDRWHARGRPPGSLLGHPDVGSQRGLAPGREDLV